MKYETVASSEISVVTQKHRNILSGAMPMWVTYSARSNAAGRIAGRPPSAEYLKDRIWQIHAHENRNIMRD